MTELQASAPTPPVQKASEGVGPLYHRIYRVPFCGAREAALGLMAKLQADLDHFSPQWIARFKKTRGSPGRLRVGDEFAVSLSAPWNAPVRVEEVTADSFTLVTLEGHLECGRIKFSVESAGERGLFSIESVARSKDSLVDFVYDKIPIARFAQGQMWERFCEAVVKECGGGEEKVEILTERKNEESGQWERI